jgi:hypothetical protein
MSAPHIDLNTPVAWKRHRIWVSKRRDFMAFAAFAPTFFGLGIELITSEAKGLSLYVGPLWLAFATIRKEPA